MDRIRAGARRGLRVAVATIATAAFTTLAAPTAHATGSTVTEYAAMQSVAMSLAAPVVGVAATPSGHGYWRAAADGGVLTAGDAHFYGSAVGRAHDTIVAVTSTPSGHGYWLTDRRGAVFNFGDAPYHGSMAGYALTHPVVGIAAAPNGKGYWLVASDGGIFAFNAPYRGSTGSIRLNKPIVGMAATPNGKGYWLVASDGGIFAFNAPFKGSTGSIRLNQPIVGMAALPNGTGYTMVARDGGLFRFPGTSPFFGSAVNACPGGPAVGVAMSPGVVGYWIAFADARTFAFSPSSPAPHCAPTATSITSKMAADLFARLNAERAARGDLHLAPLTWDPTLANYATSWSMNMGGSSQFRHSNIGLLLGAYDYVGENIAAGSAGVTDGSLHVAWMNSQGHRENILAPGFTRVGVGVYCAPGGGLWLTEDFARPTSAGTAPMPAAVPPVNPIVRPDAGRHC